MDIVSIFHAELQPHTDHGYIVFKNSANCYHLVRHIVFPQGGQQTQTFFQTEIYLQSTTVSETNITC